VKEIIFLTAPLTCVNIGLEFRNQTKRFVAQMFNLFVVVNVVVVPSVLLIIDKGAFVVVPAA